MQNNQVFFSFLMVTIAILVIGILHFVVASQERADLARFQCAQISDQIDYRVNENGFVDKESHYPIEYQYNACLQAKGLSI